MRLVVEQKAVEKAPFSKATGFGVSPPYGFCWKVKYENL
jgi:hypothetical protein